MAGTRTAPIVDATPQSVQVTLHMIDAAGDQFTESMSIDAAATDAQIEAWATAYQDSSNSSLWKITRTLVYDGAKSKTNAVAAFRSGISNGINILYKQLVLGITEAQRVVSPVTTTMVGNSDAPDPTSAELIALIAATIVCLPTYVQQRMQFTTRRERNNNEVIDA